ncbi:MAG: O-antigen ligase family protein [bacterium]
MTPVLVASSLLLYTVAVIYQRSWGIVFILIMLPSYLIRFELLGVPTTLLEFYIVILFVVWVVDWIRKHKGLLISYRALRDALPKGLGRLLLLWVIVGLVATFWSSDSIAGLGLWRAYILEPVLFVVVLITSLTTPGPSLERRGTTTPSPSYNRRGGLLKWIVRGLGIGVIIIGLISILQLAGLVPSPMPWAEELPPRFSSMFEFPNAVGLILAPIVAFFFAAVTKRESRPLPERLFIWGVLFFGLIGIALAVSEGAILGILLALVLWVLLSKHRKYWIGLGFILLIIVFAIPQTRDYITEGVTFNDTSGDVRLRVWQGTWDMLKDNPITGAGMAGFPEAYDQYRDAAHVELLQYPHNIVFNFWSEMGLIGLLLFLVLVVRFYKNAWAGYRLHKGLHQRVALGLILGMTALLGHGLVDVPYFKNDLAVLFFTLFILAEYLYTSRGAETSLMGGRKTSNVDVGDDLRNVFNKDEQIIKQELHSVVHKIGLLHQEVHVFLYTKKGEVIFQMRDRKADTAPNLLDATAGGHVEVGETYQKAAIHELEEETGINVKVEELQEIMKYQGSFHDKQTGKINNVLRMIYALPYNGKPEELRIEQGKGTGFEAWSIDQLLNISSEHRSRFIPTMLKPEYLEVYRKIQEMV